MKTVTLMAPQMYVEQPFVDVALVSLAEAAQIAFVEVREGANGLERIFRGNVKVIGGLVTDDDRDSTSPSQPSLKSATDGAGQVEIRREHDQPALGALDQLQNHGIELVVTMTKAQQRRDSHLAVADRPGSDRIATPCKHPTQPDDCAA